MSLPGRRLKCWVFNSLLQVNFYSCIADEWTYQLIFEEVQGVVALQGIPNAGHAVVRCEIVELWEYLPLPVDAVAHPAAQAQMLSDAEWVDGSGLVCSHSLSREGSYKIHVSGAQETAQTASLSTS